MFKAKYLIVLVVLALLFFNRNIFKNIMDPLLIPLNQSSQKISVTISQLSRINNIIKENRRLKKEKISLVSEVSRLREVGAENDLLKKQLKIQTENQNFDLHLVQTIGLNRILFINKKFKPGLPVIAAENVLVGITAKSGVLLSVDPESKISALIQGAEILSSAQGIFGNNLYIKLSTTENRVEPGQIVITSGREGKFPRGLIIGQIKNVEKTPNSASQQAIITPFYQAQNLDKLFVISNF